MFSWIPWTIRPTPPCSPSQPIIVASGGARTSDAHQVSVKTQVRSVAAGVVPPADPSDVGMRTWITGNVSPEKSRLALWTGSLMSRADLGGTSRRVVTARGVADRLDDRAGPVEERLPGKLGPDAVDHDDPDTLGLPGQVALLLRLALERLVACVDVPRLGDRRGPRRHGRGARRRPSRCDAGARVRRRVGARHGSPRSGVGRRRLARLADRPLPWPPGLARRDRLRELSRARPATAPRSAAPRRARPPARPAGPDRSPSPIGRSSRSPSHSIVQICVSRSSRRRAYCGVMLQAASESISISDVPAGSWTTARYGPAR